LYFDLWQYGLWSFLNGGYKIRKVFCLRINILKGNYSILRIGLVGASESKIRVCKVIYFHLLSKRNTSN
jgi:hypothetical protein